jgi:hypothetical protein
MTLQSSNHFASNLDLLLQLVLSVFGQKVQQKFLMFSASIQARITFLAMSKFTISILSDTKSNAGSRQRGAIIDPPGSRVALPPTDSCGRLPRSSRLLWHFSNKNFCLGVAGALDFCFFIYLLFISFVSLQILARVYIWWTHRAWSSFCYRS